jgi:hypothetical protein
MAACRLLRLPVNLYEWHALKALTRNKTERWERYMTDRRICKIVALMLVLAYFGLPPLIPMASAQNPYTVCIGDLCKYPSYVNLDCSFVTSHHDAIDDEAAKLVCMVRNNYEKYTYVRTGTVKGGRCGAIYVQVRCQ